MSISSHAPQCPKVLGRGAPLSLVVWLEQAEIPLLRDALHTELDLHASRRAGVGATGVGDWEDEQRTLQEMLRSLERDGDPLEVCWPTEFAHGIFRRAVLAAIEQVGKCPTASDGLRQVEEALSAAQASLATWQAYEVVDWGGLP
jgi:hypothetical protein